MEPKKRERSANFTPAEISYLIELVIQEKDTLESKKSDSSTWKSKEESWRRIEDAFNIEMGEVFRSHKVLKHKYEGIKTNLRKKFARNMQLRRETSSGKCQVESFTKLEEKLLQIVDVSVNSGTERLDDDQEDKKTLASPGIEQIEVPEIEFQIENPGEPILQEFYVDNSDLVEVPESAKMASISSRPLTSNWTKLSSNKLKRKFISTLKGTRKKKFSSTANISYNAIIRERIENLRQKREAFKRLEAKRYEEMPIRKQLLLAELELRQKEIELKNLEIEIKKKELEKLFEL